ncbi:DciA family protein [Sinimarinibacterium sp. CAU 1509]|uniref:DciA family protein n=1 Tax=Sinimarinibacterium sp. CAU 1509 TaxID=2562283 RepID=UPI00146A7235|nr:DciA family protein [Sinimarinibacterium sp. CAU 1509]
MADDNNVHIYTLMIPDPREPRSVKQLPSHDQQSIGSLLRRAQTFADINRTLSEWCSEPWTDHVRLANVRDETAVLYATTAAALVQLRHRNRSLLAWLNDRHHLHCTRIEAKVLPPATDI